MFLDKKLAKWGLTVMLLLVFLAVFSFISLFHHHSAGANPSENVIILKQETDPVNSVSYAIAVVNEDGHDELYGRIEYDNATLAGLQNYKAFNNHHLTKILQTIGPKEPVKLKITFWKPLSEIEFTEFVKEHDIKVHSYYMYMREQDGTIVTIQGGPFEGELVPHMMMNVVKDDVTERDPNAGFLGWVEVDVTAPSNQVMNLQNNPHVFMVDSMDMFFESMLTAELFEHTNLSFFAQRSLLRAGYTEVARPGPVAWWLLHLAEEPGNSGNEVLCCR